MNPLQQAMPNAPTVVFDRISTREELFEVIDLLCKNGKSEFTRYTEGQPNEDLSAFSAALSQDTLDETERLADGELLSLEHLLLGQGERLN
jgi:hypothetical protein